MNAPRWLPLAERAGTPHGLDAGMLDLTAAVGRPARFARVDGAGWLEVDLRAEDWRPHGEVADLWQAQVRLRGRDAPLGSAAQPELRGPTAAARHESSPGRGNAALERLEPWSFVLDESPMAVRARPTRVLLRVGPGEEPPGAWTLRLPVGGATGPDATGGRIHGWRFSGDGFAVWPGEQVRVTIALPPAAALHFATALEPAVIRGAAARRPVFFAVDVDGRTVFEHVVPTGAEPAFDWHRVPMPAAGSADARIEFRVSGAPAHAAFLAPTVAPAEVGDYDHRPWRRERPDIVIFLADTFRADNLAIYGGRPGVTPFLDELVRSSLVFRNAWAPATYTMASHAAMFSGFYARQTNSTSATYGLPDELETLAERLQAAGYRTGAITDAVVVSAEFGLAQGFAWWDEHQETLASTLERANAFLDADDGRPVFLFVQSYRAHTPYRPDPEMRRRHAATDDFDELQGRFVEGSRDGRRPADPSLEPTIAGLERLYRAVSADVDLGFAAFHRSLVERRVLPHGVLVFTSDHGEAFGEHGDVYHNGPVWDEQTRIPLLIHGGGVASGVAERTVSLIDLAPTVLELAGLESPADWPGRSLLADGPERPVFLFQNHELPGSTLAVVDGADKLIAYESREALREGRLVGRFDLDRDPGETRDRSAEDPDAAREALERWRPELERLMNPIVTSAPTALDPRKIEELKAMGYLTD